MNRHLPAAAEVEGGVWCMRVVDLSVVLPVYNEERNIELVYGELRTALEALGRSYEIIFVDDGSTDASFRILSAITERDPAVAAIRLRRNFGQTAALSAGIERSAGSIIILMDADLQNDPRDIGRLIAKLGEGYDVVSGWRRHRHDKWLTRKLPSKVANGLISRVTGVHLHDYGCTLKAYRRDVLEHVRLYGEMHRFIPVYATWAGGRVAELAVNHRSRKYGKSKYGLRRIMRVPLDLITVKFLGTYSTKPLYMFGLFGLFMLLAAFAVEVVAVVQRFTPPYLHLNNNPLLLLGAVLVVLAIQVILMGLLAELIMRTYYESQGKPTYLIRSVAIGGRLLFGREAHPSQPPAYGVLLRANDPLAALNDDQVPDFPPTSS